MPTPNNTTETTTLHMTSMRPRPYQNPCEDEKKFLLELITDCKCANTLPI